MPLGGPASGLTSWPTMAVSVDFTHDPMSASFTWVDLTNRTWALDITRGRGYELASVNPGAGSVTWRNDDNALDPTYGASPYSPNVLPFRRVQVTATWAGTPHNLYTGLVERWPLGWDSSHLGSVASQVTDLFAMLANKTLRSAYAEEVFADGPLAFYPLTEAAGSTSAGDISGNALPPLTIGQIGGKGDATFGHATGIPTDGTSTLGLNTTLGSSDLQVGDYLATTPFSWPNASFTIEAVISGGSTLPAISGLIYIAAQHTGTQDFGTSNAYGLMVNFNAGNMQIRDDLHATNAGPNLADGSVHHIAIVNDVTGNQTILYVDGVAVSTIAGSLTRSGSYMLTVGGVDPNTSRLGGGGGPQPFQGGLGYVAAYSTALSAARIAAHNNAAHIAFAGETADARISRLLGYAGYTSTTALDACTTTMQPALISGQSALSAIQAVETAEGGAFYMSTTGVPTYQSRRTRMATTVSAFTFGDNGTTELPYDDIDFDYDPTYIYNDIQVSRATNAVQSAADATSIGRYGHRALPVTAAITSDSEALDAANWLLRAHKDPHLRVARMVLNPATNPNLWPAVLTMDVGTRVTAHKRPYGLSTVGGDFFVEQIKHTVNAKATSWIVEVVLSPIPLQALIADDATYGICDSTFVAAW